jgi:outer membrane immunogenic protein
MLQKRIASRLVLIAAIGLAGAAARADDWSGFYVGVAGGAQFDHSKWNATGVGPANVFGVNPATASVQMGESHGRLGGYAGWMTPIATHCEGGLEADIFGATTATTRKGGLPGVNYNGAPTFDTVSESQHYDASVRARGGYRVEPGTLVYGSVGVAFREIDLKGNCPGGGGSWCGVPESQSNSKTLTGWTIGAGVETQLMPQWTVRLDYRYAGFGNTGFTLFGANNQGADQVGAKVDLTSQVVTVGITYHFSGM